MGVQGLCLLLTWMSGGFLKSCCPRSNRSGEEDEELKLGKMHWPVQCHHLVIPALQLFVLLSRLTKGKSLRDASEHF